MHGELNQLIPSFVKRAQLNEYLVGTTRGGESAGGPARRRCLRVATNEPVTLIDYDAERKKKSSRRFFTRHARQPLEQLRKSPRR